MEAVPKKRTIQKTQYYSLCPRCNKEITGQTKKHFYHNIEEHSKKCKGAKND